MHNQGVVLEVISDLLEMVEVFDQGVVLECVFKHSTEKVRRSQTVEWRNIFGKSPQIIY
jgi:hypothetical protein